VARARVLISDLDGTLVGDAAALARFADWRETHGRGWRLAYATGRTAASVLGLLGSSDLPRPDALVTEVGTVISDPDGLAWADWPPALDRWDVTTVRDVLAHEPGVAPQPDEAQSPVKASYHADALRHPDLLRIWRALRSAGVDARLVYSVGRWLDVLPRSVGKRAAARHLLGQWGVASRDVVTAGDSGNDRDLLRLGGHGIVVGNASAEVRDLRGARIVHPRASHADGVLEGLAWVGRQAGSMAVHHADATAPAVGRSGS
jgi:sucrose-phosphate synthase